MRTHIGPYRIEAPLGRGGMGVVYRGFHEHLGRPVAIKALAPELTQQPEFKERFFAEAKMQARLQHPNIVGVYDLLEDAGEYFIVMEFVAGEGLDDRLKAAAGRPVDLSEAVGIVCQVLSALDYAHSEGVIHRDIKPSNVLVAAGGRIKLTDFGIALLIGDKRLTASQSSIGTPTYMSPEQIVRPRSVDHRTDLYSAAVVFFEMLAGRPPFDDESEYGIKKLHVEAPLPDLAELRPGLPEGVVRAVATALSKNPDDRFASGGMFLRALQEAVPQAVPQGATPLPAPVYRPTTLDSTWAGSGAGTGTAAQPAAAPPATPAGPHGAVAWLLQPANRWVLAAAGVLVLGLGFGAAALLAPSAGPGQTGQTAQAASPAPGTAPAAGTTAPVSLPAPLEPLPAADPGGAPTTALLGSPPVQASSEPVYAPVPPPAPVPTPKPRRQVPPASAPAPALSEPAPPPVVPEPAPAPSAAPEPAVAEPPSASSANAGIDQFKEMEALVVSIANLSEKALEAYEEEDRDDELLNRLGSFSEAAIGTRREFRKATGTGWRGNLGKVLGKAGDTKALQLKVQELSRRGDEIDRLIQSSSPGVTTQEYWREIRSTLRRLSGYF